MSAVGEPKKSGFDASRLERLRGCARSWIDEGVHNSLVLYVARHGEVALHEAFGRCGPEADAGALTVDAIFPLQSLTKPFTATLVLMLAEDGHIGLSRPVREYLPEFVGDQKDAVLVHHLLTHTSGIDDWDSYHHLERLALPLLGTVSPDPTQHPFTDVLLDLLFSYPLVEPVGSIMRYANGNHVLLGEIVRRVTGRSLDDVARELVFEPLGMTSSSYGLPAARDARLVRRRPTPGDALMTPEARTPPGGVGGAAAMYGTAGDVATWFQMVLDAGRTGNGQLLAASTIDRMITDQLPGLEAVIDGPVVVRAREASWSWALQVGGTVPWQGNPLFPDGAVGHLGAGVHCGWANPTTGVVAVYCSVADASDEAALPPMGEHRIEAFADLVRSAVSD